MKLRDIAFIHISLIGFLLLSTVALLFFTPSQAVITYTQVVLFITYFWTLFAQINLNGFKHIFTIFLGLFFLFLLGIPFFDLLGGLDIRSKFLFVRPDLSDAVYIKTYIYTSFFIAFVFLGVLFGYKSPSNLKEKVEVDFNSYLYSVGLLLFFVSFPGILTKYYLQFQVVFQKGYLSIYDGSLQKINYPIICSGAGTILVIGYCLFIASKPKRKQFLIITTIFLLTQIVNMLKGQRSVVMFPFVFAFWFYFKYYILNISKKKLIIIVLSVVVLSQVIGLLRATNDYVNIMKNKSFTEKYISSFFEEQGVSFFILPYMMHYGLENDRYPYLFAPLDIRSYGKPQSMNRLVNYNYLPDQLMYKMLPDEYKKGLGIGSSILGVFYDLPKIIAIALCIAIGFLIARFEAYVKTSRMLLLSSYYIVFAIASSPRYEPLQLFYDLVMLWVAYAVIKLMNPLIQVLTTKKETTPFS